MNHGAISLSVWFAAACSNQKLKMLVLEHKSGIFLVRRRRAWAELIAPSSTYRWRGLKCRLGPAALKELAVLGTEHYGGRGSHEANDKRGIAALRPGHLMCMIRNLHIE